MRHLLPLLLLLAACGSGADGDLELMWLPDFSTPESATEAYIRALETDNLDLALIATVRDEQEHTFRNLSGLLAAAREQGVRFEVEVVEGSAHITDSLAWLDIKLVSVNKDGEPTRFTPPGRTQSVGYGNVLLAFVPQPDGSWRFSPVQASRLNQEREDAKAAARESQAGQDAPAEPKND